MDSLDSRLIIGDDMKRLRKSQVAMFFLIVFFVDPTKASSVDHGSDFFNKGDYVRAVPLLQQSAENQIIFQTQLQIAIGYNTATPVIQDIKKNSSILLNNTAKGLLHLNANVTSHDSMEGWKLLQQEADPDNKNDMHAQYLVGIILNNPSVQSFTIVENAVKAFFYFKFAALQGHVEAINVLAQASIAVPSRDIIPKEHWLMFTISSVRSNFSPSTTMFSTWARALGKDSGEDLYFFLKHNYLKYSNPWIDKTLGVIVREDSPYGVEFFKKKGGLIGITLSLLVLHGIDGLPLFINSAGRTFPYWAKYLYLNLLNIRGNKPFDPITAYPVVRPSWTDRVAVAGASIATMATVLLFRKPLLEKMNFLWVK